MLVAPVPATTSFGNKNDCFDGPRIISEVRKSPISGFSSAQWDDIRPKLTGELLVKCANEKKWWPRRVSIRNGQLQMAGGHGDGAPAALRLPLRHLSLQAGALSNSLSLCKGPAIILTLQTTNEQSFDQWVKTIAIELIRQTPLEAVKYLDIFALAYYWKCNKSAPAQQQQQPQEDKDCNFNDLDEPDGHCQTCDSQCSAEKTVQHLLKKCQNSELYVPVKEKLILFESLSKLGRKVRSTEDVSSCRTATSPASPTKRARSLHDLSNYGSQRAVREMCKYFEEAKTETTNTDAKYGTTARKKLVYSDK